jgi:hypothetical protein
MYAEDSRYVPDEDKPGSFRIAHDADHRKRHGHRHTILALEGGDRVQTPAKSRRQAKRRRRAKGRRKS